MTCACDYPKVDDVNVDKINFGMSRKLSDGNYGSVEVHFSYTTDVKPFEDLKLATERCINYVEEVLVHKIEEVQKCTKE